MKKIHNKEIAESKKRIIREMEYLIRAYVQIELDEIRKYEEKQKN